MIVVSPLFAPWSLFSSLANHTYGRRVSAVICETATTHAASLPRSKLVNGAPTNLPAHNDNDDDDKM